MSVAFRRESDEEHLQPRFELPLPPGPNPVTKRGYELIAARNEALELELTTTPAGDHRTELLRDVRYWRSRLATAQVAPRPSGNTVAIGTVVTIEREGYRRVLEVVGHDESDPASGRIGFAAPLARALIGAEVGDEVDLPSPVGVVTVTEVSIRPD
ncbi:GreA/GreB family elongation factor [Sphingomonas sp.]|uniref:GreA/GreB family elongation factor n=1 Tax=Sphingomonas sp. TaxID=28214 RepID=UPI003751B77F